MEWERTCILASHLGMMQRLIETCVKYARERQQFGQPIGKYSAIANKVADMEVRLETGRLLLYKAAWLKSQGRHALREASMAKLYVSEATVQTCLDAIQIHGGYGYTTEYEMERDLRDAISGKIYSGTSEIQKVIIAGFQGLDVEYRSFCENDSLHSSTSPAKREPMAYILQQLLKKSAARYPEKIAVWARGRSITYRELDEQSNRLAHLLQRQGVKKGDRVGLYFPKSIESIVSMFGVLKAGGVYVPCDPAAPAGSSGLHPGELRSARANHQWRKAPRTGCRDF